MKSFGLIQNGFAVIALISFFGLYLKKIRSANLCSVLSGPSLAGTYHIFIEKFSYFDIRFLNQIFWSLIFFILLSDFYL